jgi:4-coumarate--CoA ligase (photoactive yellow protein activation family)
MNKLIVDACSFAFNCEGLKYFFNSQQLRRIDPMSKLALFCAAKLLNKAGLIFDEPKYDIALIIATGRGPCALTLSFMDDIIDDDATASALKFSASVHNVIETTITTLLNLRGISLTISQGTSSFASAAFSAKNLLMAGKCKKVLLGAIDEVHAVLLKEYAGKVYPKDVAAFFLLSLGEEGKELIIDDNTDKFNPSLSAFNLAKKYSNFLEKHEVEKIACDFIETYLSSKKIKQISVFENYELDDLLKGLTKTQIKIIFDEIKILFCVDPEVELSSKNLIDVCFNAAQEKNKIVFSTSGSTGVPQRFTHLKSQIHEELSGVADLFGNINKIICVVPTHHSYGFIFGFELSRILDVPICFHDPLPIMPPKLLVQGDLLVCFPTFLEFLNRVDFKFPKDITILSSTAPCPDILIDKMFLRGAAHFIEIYGSSESGAIAYRTKSGAPFKLLPFWNCEIKDGYISKISRKTTDLSLKLPDIARVSESGEFFLEGRKDKAIQVAGINVYPIKIEKILKQLDFIKDVSVRPDDDKRLKAFIVFKDGVNTQKAQKDLRAFMNTTLSSYEIPHNLKFGTKIPVTAYGKKSDW